MGNLVNLCSYLGGFYIMGLHAQVLEELAKLCFILGGFYIMELHAHVMGELFN